ncbi:DUF3685 domain-containing protein [Crocosphaera sp. UHCC 0190]|uniref:DUF3685 domain-containing protein n=1 Tax=Crocosphaera sp. UHCC 0190 TaxID=3110246 RepID=UPI002B21A87B|nr:DUF3685 domain-containing protein [Crocosphaera sp. UHCC 0190]MEA5508152.1 DUF3685 domain-containing protein [Crocosphaera sp. UHCC 0190]
MSDHPINLLLVDDDPIFCLGLSTALSNYSRWEIIAQTDNFTDSLTELSSQRVELIILEPNIADRTLTISQFYQEVKQTYPQVKVCLLSHLFYPSQLQNFKDLGIEGYCHKGIPIEDFLNQLERIIQGEVAWPNLIIPTKTPERVFHKPWLSRLQKSGIDQIQANLNIINQKLQESPLSKLDQLFWKGRKRELLAAYWIVERLIPVEVIVIENQSFSPGLSPGIKQKQSDSLEITGSITESPTTLIIFNNTLDKLEGNLKNLTKIPLEIDILKPEIKQELLRIILNQFRRILEDLKFVELLAKQLSENMDIVLGKIWRESALTFLGKYCVEKQKFRLEEIEEILNNYEMQIEEEILRKIPFVTELLDYLLFESHLIVEQVSYRPDSPEAIEQGEKFLQNLIIQVANGITSLILNNFSDVELIKQKLYCIKMASSREIANFRNKLAWQYRQEQYWGEPQNIFESRYRLFFLKEKGLDSSYIYAPRQTQLENLTGLRWSVTILLEIRDAFSPILRSILASLGNGLVYLLTQVIGRGLGLIGRGILQGVGNSFQETSYPKKRSERDSKS